MPLNAHHVRMNTFIIPVYHQLQYRLHSFQTLLEHRLQEIDLSKILLEDMFFHKHHRQQSRVSSLYLPFSENLKIKNTEMKHHSNHYNYVKRQSILTNLKNRN